MQTTIDIHDLARRLDEVRGLSGDDEILLTSGSAPIARLLPLVAEFQNLPPAVSRLANPFLGEFTDEDFKEAKAILALGRPGYTTEEVIARLRTMGSQ